MAANSGRRGPPRRCGPRSRTMPPRNKTHDPMAAVDALPLVQELEKALACLDAVEKDVDEGKRPGKDMDAFFQQLGRVDDAAAALP